MSSQFNETEDDLPLHTRGTAREAYGRTEGHAAEMMNDTPAPEREVTLNTGVVLGLFFALALLCAVFFGFGYSIGHKSAPVAAASTEPEVVTTTDSAGTSSATPKPSANVPQAVPEYVPSTGADRAAATAVKPVQTATAPGPRPVVLPSATPGAEATPPARVVRVPPPAAEAPVLATAPTISAGPGSTYVQVAAVSHQEDADVLLSALHRRGYAVQTRSEAADHLIHVQLGPFGTRKEAEAMRLRLAGDGYNAFIK